MTVKRLEYWASIALTNETLYVTSAAEGTARTVGGTLTQFKPVLIVGEFSDAFQALNVSTLIPTSVTLTLVNRDGWLDDYLGFGPLARVWDNRLVTIKYGGTEGGPFDTSAMRTEFTGRIRRGTLKHSQDSVTFDLYDFRQQNDKALTAYLGTFDADTWPNAAVGVSGLNVPVVYGDFTTEGGPASGGRLPAYCVDTTTGTYQVAAHGITNISVYWYDASADTTALLVGGGVDYTDTATGFTLSAAQLLLTDVNADIFTVNCKGRNAVPQITGGGATTLQYAVDIMADILILYGGAVIGDINTTEWLAAHTAGDTHLNRRWINTELTVMQAVGELAFENNYLFYADPTQYRLSFALPKADVTAAITAAEAEAGSVRSVYDPDSSYMNAASSSYDEVAVGDSVGNYRYSVALTNATAVTEYGSTIRGLFTFHWLFQKSPVSLQTERKLLVLSSKAHYVDFTLAAEDASARNWRLTLAVTLTLTAWQYTATPLQIRTIRRDAESGRISVRALAVQDAFQVAQWSGGTYTIPTGSTFPARWTDATLLPAPIGRWF